MLLKSNLSKPESLTWALVFAKIAEKSRYIVNPIERIVMFKFRRNKSTLVTIRAKDLQVADRFVYDTGMLEVLDIIPGPEETVVRLGSYHPDFWNATRQVPLYNELLIDVTR